LSYLWLSYQLREANAFSKTQFILFFLLPTQKHNLFCSFFCLLKATTHSVACGRSDESMSLYPQVVSAYLWLSYQLKETQFPHRAKAEQLLASMVELLDRRLASSVHKRPRLTQSPVAKKPFVPGFSTGGDSFLGRLRSSESEELEGPRIAAAL
jgi:FlaA1/EpsC-like NDP-sugar epimerase